MEARLACEPARGNAHVLAGRVSREERERHPLRQLASSISEDDRSGACPTAYPANLR